jgi:hypothetical protein
VIVTSTTYSTSKKVMEFMGLYSSVVAEAVGTGDGTTALFYLDYVYPVNGTLVIYVAGTAKTEATDYTIDYDTGYITFLAGKIPTVGQAITADYRYIDIPNTVVEREINYAEDEIDRRIGRTFMPSVTVTNEVYSGDSRNWVNPFSFQATSFLNSMEDFRGDKESFFKDRTVLLLKYPVLNLVNIFSSVNADQTFSDVSLGDTSYAFGKTTYLSQGFTPAQTGQVVRAKFYLKYSTGTAAAITVSLYATSSGIPTGSALATATISSFTSTTPQWYSVDFAAPYQTVGGTTYALVLSSDSTSATNTFICLGQATGTYSGGGYSVSTNSGTAWAAVGVPDLLFIEYYGALVPPENYEVFKDWGVVVFKNAQEFKKGLANFYVSYSYGYASVPGTVEKLCTRMVAMNTMMSRLMANPAQSLSIPAGNIQSIQREIDRLFQSVGERLEVSRL